MSTSLGCLIIMALVNIILSIKGVQSVEGDGCRRFPTDSDEVQKVRLRLGFLLKSNRTSTASESVGFSQIPTEAVGVYF